MGKGLGIRGGITFALTMAASTLGFAPGAHADPSCAEWIPVATINARYGHAMAFDSARGVTVLFGGCYNDGADHYLSDTWEWDGSMWIRRRPAASPPARAYHAMAYDAARGVSVLFGGVYDDGAYHYLADTWEWDGTNWLQSSPATNPSGRAGHAMAYDTARGVTLLCAGSSGFNELGDTWAWNGAAWTMLTSGTSPPVRSWHSMAYDSARSMVVMFGGEYWDDALHYLGDT